MRASNLRFCHLEPVLDQADAVIDDLLLKFRADLEEAPVLFLSAEAHDIFDAGPVVPTAVEDHDLASGREMRHVTLRIHLRFFTVRGGRAVPRVEKSAGSPARSSP